MMVVIFCFIKCLLLVLLRDEKKYSLGVKTLSLIKHNSSVVIFDKAQNTNFRGFFFCPIIFMWFSIVFNYILNLFLCLLINPRKSWFMEDTWKRAWKQSTYEEKRQILARNVKWTSSLLLATIQSILCWVSNNLMSIRGQYVIANRWWVFQNIISFWRLDPYIVATLKTGI